nr:H/ACA ribonucleoprotein complex non-core subunit NAF1-like [Penaeus vannamei]
MGNKQHRALGAEDEFDAALNSSHSGTRRKRKLRSAAVHSKHAGTCGEGAEDEADKKPRGGEKVQKVQREKHRHAPPPAPSPAPASPTNSSGKSSGAHAESLSTDPSSQPSTSSSPSSSSSGANQSPSEVSDNHEILPPPERRAENEHDESSCDTDSDSCLENTQSGGESIRDTSSAHESSGELSSVPTPPKAGKPRKDGFSRRQRKTREKPRECESSEILEAVNEYEEVEELAPCLRSPKRIAKDDHMQRAGKASEKRRKRESVELVISEIYQEEDSFCTSYLEEEFSGDIIKIYIPKVSEPSQTKSFPGCVFQDISYVKGESKLSGEAVYVEGAAAFGLIFEKG